MLLLAGLLAGCTPPPRMLSVGQQISIDRSLITCPAGFAVQPFIRNLSAPTAIAWDEDGSLLVAEGGNYNEEPRIIGFKKDGTLFQIYPHGRTMIVDIGKPRFVMYGPIGGMLVYNKQIYVSHRDEEGFGRITALDRNGGHTTIVAHLPAQGDYPVTDLAISHNTVGDVGRDRLYFGVGSATNSGVVGLDNWEWVQDYPQVHDVPWVPLVLNGYRFDSSNPFSGLFGPADKAVTAPFQPFDLSNRTNLNGGEMPNAAIYSCSPNGGDLHIEGHGIRYPRGIGFNSSTCFFTNEGMELRGTRPVKNDPDAMLTLEAPGNWYGWPDYTTDLRSVNGEAFQPPAPLISRTGYFSVMPVINLELSQQLSSQYRFALADPSQKADTLVKGRFAPLSGAAKFDFLPNSGPFSRRPGRRAIVALSGDRAPFATSGYPIVGPIGHKIVAVEIDSPNHPVTDYVLNTGGGPGSHIDEKNANLLERPVDVKFGPDGTIYILDGGRMEIHNGRAQWEPGTGKIFRVVPQAGTVMSYSP